MIAQGIILAGGTGSRLYPISLGASKQLLPIYSKPMIYYPLAVLMLAGIRRILVITTPHEQAAFKRLLGTGKRFGITIAYAIQATPQGIAEAFLVGQKFIAGEPTALVLGDNIFYGEGLADILAQAVAQKSGATIFAYPVENPNRYGVVSFDAAGAIASLDEKPAVPLSNYAITGLYFYDSSVIERVRQLRPSPRGELEITDLNRHYLEDNDLRVHRFGPDMVWLDTGTPQAMLKAANFVEAIETRQGLMIACPEEIAWRQGWIGERELTAQARAMGSSHYGQYLLSLAHCAASSNFVGDK